MLIMKKGNWEEDGGSYCAACITALQSLHRVLEKPGL